jgi:hypothetical protein
MKYNSNSDFVDVSHQISSAYINIVLAWLFFVWHPPPPVLINLELSQNITSKWKCAALWHLWYDEPSSCRTLRFARHLYSWRGNCSSQWRGDPASCSKIMVGLKNLGLVPRSTRFDLWSLIQCITHSSLLGEKNRNFVPSWCRIGCFWTARRKKWMLRHHIHNDVTTFLNKLCRELVSSSHVFLHTKPDPVCSATATNMGKLKHGRIRKFGKFFLYASLCGKTQRNIALICANGHRLNSMVPKHVLKFSTQWRFRLFDNFYPPPPPRHIIRPLPIIRTFTIKKAKKRFHATGPGGSWRLRLPGFLNNRHMKVVRLSALRTGRLYPQEGFLVLISVKG